MVFTQNGVRLWAALAGILMVITADAGCGKPAARAPTKEVPVTGKITLDGSPLADAEVRFTTETFATFAGATDSAGTYKLWSQMGGEQTCEGRCGVTVSKFILPEGVTPEPDMSPMMQGGTQLLPQKCWDLDSTVLTANVPKEGGTFDFALQSK